MAQQFDWNQFPKAQGSAGSVRQPSGGSPAAFDWGQFPTEPEKPGLAGSAMAAVRGFGQGITGGYAPQLQAMAEPITDRVMNALPGPDVEPASFKQMIPGSPEYIAARDQNIRTQQAVESKHPNASLAGNIGGLLATSVIPGKVFAQSGKGIVKGALKGAAIGSAEAAAMNPGDTEGEFNPTQISERLDNAKLGALFGGAGGAGARVVSSGVSKAKNAAEHLAFKASGAMLKDFRAAASRGKVNDLGRFMLDRVLKAGDTFDDVAEKTKAIKTEAGKEIGKTYREVLGYVSGPNSLKPEQRAALAARGFKPKSQREEVLASISEKLGDSPNSKAAMNFVTEYIDDLGAKYGDDIDIVRANKIKGDIDSAINYAKRAQDLPEKQEALLVLRNHIRSKVEGHIDELDKIVGTDKVRALREANRVYGAASELESIAFDRVQRESANRFFSLGDRLTGAATLTTGGVAGGLIGGDAESAAKGALIGLGGAAASRVARKYGPHAAAKGLDLASKGSGSAAIPSTIGSASAKGSAGPEYKASPSSHNKSSERLGDKNEEAKDVAERSPKGGPDKWARDGLKNLGISGPKAESLLKSKQGKRLLIEASDLRPGSARLNRIKEEIQKLRTG